MLQHSTGSHRDERWAIKIFRPLLKLLNVQNISSLPDTKVIYMADKREWIINGMGRCVVVIEQHPLPGNASGLLITSHDTELDYFTLHIIIASSLCGKSTLNERADQKITAIHEFLHAVAALSAISIIKSNLLIERLKTKFREKAHAIYFKDIKEIADELRSLISDAIDKVNNSNTSTPNEYNESEKKSYFPDQHFRLGFEDFPVSYPVIFEEFLLSKEMFEEYYPNTLIHSLCEALTQKDIQALKNGISPPIAKIVNDKALYPEFAVARILNIIMCYHTNKYKIKK